MRLTRRSAFAAAAIALFAALGVGQACCRTVAEAQARTVEAPQLRGRSALAQAAAEPLGARHDDRRLGRRPGQRLDHPPRRRPRSNANERALELKVGECCTAAPPVLVFDQAGNLVRSWGGPGQGYEWPESQPRHPRRLQGQRLDRRQRREGRAPAQVHQGRQVPDAGRQARRRQGQQRPRELRPRGQDLGRSEDQRGLRRRRLQNKRVAVLDADTGKMKRYWGAYGNKPDDADLGKYDPGGAAAEAVPQPGALRRAQPTTAWSTSATGRPTASRSSIPTARS